MQYCKKTKEYKYKLWLSGKSFQKLLRSSFAAEEIKPIFHSYHSNSVKGFKIPSKKW